MASLQKEFSAEKLNGKVYTPITIVNKILDEVGYFGKHILGKKIIDPSCGDGQFLVQIVRRIIKQSPTKDLVKNLQCVYGYDIDCQAIKQCIYNLNQQIAELGIKVNWNIQCKNSILLKQQQNLFCNNKDTQTFDFVVGNPPYIRIQHLDWQTRKFIQEKYSFCTNGSTDLYIAFYELAYELINDNGIIAYISPNSFLRSSTAKIMRDFLSNKKVVKKIINYGTIQIFNNVSTYTAIVILTKGNNKNLEVNIANDIDSFRKSILEYKDLDIYPFWQLEQIEQKNGKKLKDVADIFTGIATLADKVYVGKLVKKQDNFIFLNFKNKGIIKLEQGILKPIIKASKYKNNNQKIDEYIIYPYILEKELVSIMQEDFIKKNYPCSYEYLLSVKDILDKRDAGKPNPTAWYAYGRSQGLKKCFGKKIIFSPISDKPRFMVCDNEEAMLYSGYGMKYDGDLYSLANKLSGAEMETYINNSSSDFRGGWKGYNKTIVQEFILEGI